MKREKNILNEVTYIEKHCIFFSVLNVSFKTFDKYTTLVIQTEVRNLVRAMVRGGLQRRGARTE